MWKPAYSSPQSGRVRRSPLKPELQCRRASLSGVGAALVRAARAQWLRALNLGLQDDGALPGRTGA